MALNWRLGEDLSLDLQVETHNLAEGIWAILARQRSCERSGTKIFERELIGKGEIE